MHHLNEWAIGVDLGGTNIDVAQVDSAGNIHERLQLITDSKNGPLAVEAQIRDAIADICNKNSSRPVGMGIGVAGQIEASSGIVKFAPNLGWQDFPLLQKLKDHLKLSGITLNDVRAAAWGEWLYGAGRGSKDIVCLFVGTGIGGGVVSEGKMLNGFCNSAGELGHITIDMHGPACHCGNKGCFEALASGWAIARITREAITADPEKGKALLELANNDIKKVTGRIVAQGIEMGNSMAVEIFENVSEALVAGAVSIVNAYNPERLILGGGVIDGLPSLIDKIKDGVKKRALPDAAAAVSVVPAELKDDSGVIGAAALAIQVFKTK